MKDQETFTGSNSLKRKKEGRGRGVFKYLSETYTHGFIVSLDVKWHSFGQYVRDFWPLYCDTTKYIYPVSFLFIYINKEVPNKYINLLLVSTKQEKHRPRLSVVGVKFFTFCRHLRSKSGFIYILLHITTYRMTQISFLWDFITLLPSILYNQSVIYMEFDFTLCP